MLLTDDVVVIEGVMAGLTERVDVAETHEDTEGVTETERVCESEVVVVPVVEIDAVCDVEKDAVTVIDVVDDTVSEVEGVVV